MINEKVGYQLIGTIGFGDFVETANTCTIGSGASIPAMGINSETILELIEPFQAVVDGVNTTSVADINVGYYQDENSIGAFGGFDVTENSVGFSLQKTEIAKVFIEETAITIRLHIDDGLSISDLNRGSARIWSKITVLPTE